jgi:hypothetical protein
MKHLRIATLIGLSTLPALAQVPDSGTRHDRRASYLEFALSANAGIPDNFLPQIELMAKRRGWPVFAIGRFGVGYGNWLGHGTILATPQVALHWTRDGDDSWALRLGWVMGEWVSAIGSNIECDSIHGCDYLESKLLGNTLAVERTAYFPGSRDFAWRVSLGVATAWHQYELRGAPHGEKTTGIAPFFNVGLLWTSF